MVITVRFLPDWMPFPFKAVAKKGLALQERMHYWPWEQTVKHYVSPPFNHEPQTLTQIPLIESALGSRQGGA
jgi:hypothetical protein